MSHSGRSPLAARSFFRLLPGLALAVLLVATSSPAAAQQRSGTVLGFLPESKPKLESGFVLSLRGQETGEVVQETTPDDAGHFIFHDVPFGSYYLTVSLDSVLVTVRAVTVTSAVPVSVNIESLAVYQTREVQVSAPASRLLDRARTGAARSFTPETIEALPSPTGEKKVESLLLATPGVVPDEDGRLHVRGEDAQLQYVIDGIPVTGNMTRVYSSLFDAGVIKTADVLTGNLRAEYGTDAAGIVAVTTKSGFERPLFGRVTGLLGSFDARETRFEAGGNRNGRTALFVTGSRTASDRYLDPIAQGPPNHDSGDGTHFFGEAQSILTPHLRLNLLGSANHTDYSVPNSLRVEPGQDQRQELNDYLLGGRLAADLDSQSVVSAVLYRRRARARTTSGGLMEIGSPADSARAVTENEKLFIGGDRVNATTGAQVELSLTRQWAGRSHALKAGLGGEIYPLKEFFTFAVTNPALSDSTAPGGDSRFLPYDITQGGSPFLVDTERTGRRASAWLQDDFQIGRLGVAAGLRYDLFDLFSTEHFLSPRLNFLFEATPNLLLRLGYQRIVMQAPVENVLVASSAQARDLSGDEQGSIPNEVRSEKAHVVEMGLAKRWPALLDLDFTIYGKSLRDFIGKTELENSGVIFPLNIREGLVLGTELGIRTRERRHLSGTASLSLSRAVGLIPDDGLSPVTGGLILGEEGRNYSDPWRGEAHFKTEHDQLLTAVAGVNYNHPSGPFGALNWRFDSGLPFDLVGADGEGLNEEEAREELRRRGYTDDVIDLLNLKSEKPGSPDKSVAPHQTVDVGAGFDFSKRRALPVRLAGGIINVFDTDYLYKFESSFGATHFGRPRTYTIQIDLIYR